MSSSVSGGFVRPLVQGGEDLSGRTPEGPDEEDPAELFLVGAVAGQESGGNRGVGRVYPRLFRGGQRRLLATSGQPLPDAGMVCQCGGNLPGGERRGGVPGVGEDILRRGIGPAVNDLVDPPVNVEAGAQCLGQGNFCWIR